MATEKDTVCLTDHSKEAHARILRRFRFPIACVLCSTCMLAIFIGITVSTVRASVPSVHPTAVAINVTEDSRGIRAIVNADTSDGSQWHDVALQHSACQLHMICEHDSTDHCPLFWVHLEDASYVSPTQARFVLEATHLEPSVVQRVYHADPRDVSVSCDLVVEVDLFRTGFRVVRDVSVVSDAQTIFEAFTSPQVWPDVSADENASEVFSVSFDLVHRNFTAPRLRNPVAYMDSTYNLIVVAPAGSRMATMLGSFLQNTQVTVQAALAYNEKGGAFGMRAATDSSLQFYNDSAGNVVLVLPVSLTGSTHFPMLAQTVAAAAVGLLPRSADNGTWHHTASMGVEASAPESALAVIFGAQHTLSIVDDQKRGPINLPGRRRLNENVFGVEHNIRIWMDDNPFIGIDYHLIDGSPLTFVAGFVMDTIPDPMDAERDHFQYSQEVSTESGEMRRDSGGGEVPRSVVPYRELENFHLLLNVTADLDMERETASIELGMQQSGGSEEYRLEQRWDGYEGDMVDGSMTAHPFELRHEQRSENMHINLAASLDVPSAVASASITLNVLSTEMQSSSFINKEYFTGSESGWVASNRPNESHDDSDDNITITFSVVADFDGDSSVASDKGTMRLRIDPHGLGGLDPIVLDITRTQEPDGEEEIFEATMTMGMEGDRRTQNNPFSPDQFHECNASQPETYFGEDCTDEHRCCAYYQDHPERCEQAEDWGFDAYAECCACGRSPKTRVEFDSGVNATGRVVINSGRRRSATSLQTVVTPQISVFPYCQPKNGGEVLNLNCTELDWDDDSQEWMFDTRTCCEETMTGLVHEMVGIDIGTAWTSPGNPVARLTENEREDFEFMTHGHDFTLLAGFDLEDEDAFKISVETNTNSDVMNMDIVLTEGGDTVFTADAGWTQNATGDSMVVMLEDSEIQEVGTISVAVNQAEEDIWTMKGSFVEPEETDAAADGFATLDFSGENHMSATGRAHERDNGEVLSFHQSLSDDDSTMSVRSSVVFDHEEVEGTEFDFVYGGSSSDEMSLDIIQRMDRDCSGEGAAKVCISQALFEMHMDATHPDTFLGNTEDRVLMLAQPFRMNMYLDIMEEDDEDDDEDHYDHDEEDDEDHFDHDTSTDALPPPPAELPPPPADPADLAVPADDNDEDDEDDSPAPTPLPSTGPAASPSTGPAARLLQVDVDPAQTARQLQALSSIERLAAQVARRPQDDSPAPRVNMTRVLTTMMTFEQPADNMLEGGTFIYGGSVNNANLRQDLVLEMGMVFDSSSSERMSMEMSMWADNDEEEQEEIMYASSDMDYEGDYMAGPLLMTMGDEEMTMDMRMSRGFLTSTAKGADYDVFDAAMSFDIMDEVRFEMSAYLERGPDLGISGLGHEATISELQNNSGSIMPVPRVWQSMDVNFVPGSAQAFVPEPSANGTEVVYTETVFETVLTMDADALADFTFGGFLSSVAATTGLAEDKVSVESVSINITVEYAFDETVTTGQAREAVASANVVSESQVFVSVASARRLTERRRLADVNYEVVIVVPIVNEADLSTAIDILASSADADILAASLQVIAPDAPPPTVTQQPQAVVTVQTALRTSDGVVQEAPDSADLQQEIATQMDIEVEATTSVVSQTVTTCTDTCETAEVVVVQSGQASHALGMQGHLPFALLSAIALWSFTLLSA